MEKPKFQKTALTITRWIGSVQSVVIHTIIFVLSFGAVFTGQISLDRMLLVLTTVLSLEAIYLAIFIQMTINIQQESLQEVEADIDEIQEDIDEIQEDVEDIQEDTQEDEVRDVKEEKTLEEIRTGLAKLLTDFEKLNKK